MIQAKKFELVNGDKKVVASFYASMGGGMLSFSNKDGKIVPGIHAGENGDGRLKTSDSKGQTTSRIP